MSRCRRVATNPMRAGKRRITVLLLLHWLADMCPGRTRVPTPRPKSSLRRLILTGNGSWLIDWMKGTDSLLRIPALLFSPSSWFSRFQLEQIAL
ncbi:hypothetical protein PVAP13_2NG651550 [Panicum virgatum]|uniref:Secreted protein n=1 Tax=Panicum virgatum TaxID=38727 RepID=A0A8T0VW18_PANVG|nr:hypothetical protein PVAP13_2NG651550 [Panicum virgatum]